MVKGKARFIVLLLLVVGIALIAGSVYLAQQCYAFVHAAQEATGKIVDQRYYRYNGNTRYDTHYPIVQFRLPSGATIKRELTDTSSRTLYATGIDLPVLYLQQPGKPILVRSGAFLDIWQTTLVMAGVGIAFSLPFIFTLVSSMQTSARMARLRDNGQRIVAKISGVVVDNTEMINGRGAYRIESTWTNPLSGADITFRSERIWIDPTPHLQGDIIPVYINPSDPGDYIMDLSFLPK